MDDQALLNELLDLAERLGIEVRQNFLGGAGGGLCRLRGKEVLFVDTGSAVVEQVARTAEALAERVDLDATYLLPQVREVIEQRGR